MQIEKDKKDSTAKMLRTNRTGLGSDFEETKKRIFKIRKDEMNRK